MGVLSDLGTAVLLVSVVAQGSIGVEWNVVVALGT